MTENMPMGKKVNICACLTLCNKTRLTPYIAMTSPSGQHYVITAFTCISCTPVSFRSKSKLLNMLDWKDLPT